MNIFGSREPKWNWAARGYTHTVDRPDKFCRQHGCELEFSIRITQQSWPKFDRDTGHAIMEEVRQWVCPKYEWASSRSCDSFFYKIVGTHLDATIEKECN